MKIPLIDLSLFSRGGRERRRSVARDVDSACRESGFLVIAGHGVARALMRSADRALRDFFALPLEEKRRTCAPGAMRGYLALGSETLSYSLGRRTPPDLSESFVIGPLDVPDEPYYRGAEGRKYFAPNVWPPRPKELEPILTEYYRAMDGLSRELLRLFAAALELPERFFEDKTDKPISRLRPRHSPKPAKPPLTGQLLAGAHTDYGSLTILRPDDALGGLQVNSRSGRWRAVPRVEDALIVNTGDLMARWTNDRWVSTLHRVVDPPRPAGRGRLTIPFFHYPNYDARVECLSTCREPGRPAKYPPVTAGEHLREKVSKTVRAAQ